MLAEMFQLFGTIGIKAEGAYKDLQQFEDRVQQTANGMQDKFQKAGESISHVGVRQRFLLFGATYKTKIRICTKKIFLVQILM
ncbi:hypothetical protein ABEP43_17115 [Bacillus paranthracis]